MITMTLPFAALTYTVAIGIGMILCLIACCRDNSNPPDDLDQ